MMQDMLLEQAIEFAREKHAGQVDKQGQPYMRHLHRVLGLAQGYEPFDERLHAAAVLHDVVEDTDATLEDVEKQFGYIVMRVVKYVSHIHGDTYMERIDAIREAPGVVGRFARLVKRADLQDHLDTIHLLKLEDRSLAKRYIKAARRLGLHVKFKLVPQEEK